jgi:ribosomal protein S18 acetylase RimI-like enzyme
MTVREGSELVGAWPLYLRLPRSGALRVRELRLVGDFGAARRSLLCRPDDTERVVPLLVDGLTAERGWDVVDVPLLDRVADAFEGLLTAQGKRVDRSEAAGRPYLDLPAGLPREPEAFLPLRRAPRTIEGAVYAPAELDLPHAIDELLRLQRLEWAVRDAAAPASDSQLVQFLREVVPDLIAKNQARLGLVGLAGEGAIAADFVVVDGDRHIQLLRGADPDYGAAGVSEQLTYGSIEQAMRSGGRRFELADDDSPFQGGRERAARMRWWNSTAAGRLHRGVVSLREAVRTPETRGRAPTSQATRARGALEALGRLREVAPDVVQRAMARVATYSTLHLYRGELFTRGVRGAPDLQIGLFSRADFERRAPPAREVLIGRLDLQESYCRQKWERGDLVVLAEAGGRAAGIVWCARAPVFVPDIGREVRPGPNECYIHDVYVHPDQRGLKVAPAMLDFLAGELRARDCYRAWALIERTNIASTRAFEKASYASVADVIYARMGLASRLIVRPPDPEARAFLGLV